LYIIISGSLLIIESIMSIIILIVVLLLVLQTCAIKSSNISVKKNVIITGANSGIGLATVKNLCASGEYNVIMACRDVNKAKSVASKIRYGKENIEILPLDLADLRRY